MGAHDILYFGPSGIITKSGRNIQLTEDLQLATPGRSKRSVPYFSPSGASVGVSGIVHLSGVNTQFSHELANDILLIGPSGIITKSGRNIQLTDDLRIAFNARTKRSLPLVGPSGMILEDGTQVQFKEAGATVLLDGPSGIVMSDGTLVQKRAKRHIIGHSGIITSTGQLIQLEPGVSVVHAGPSGIVLSNGKNIQLN